ncbi:putative reverse transcriptase zinc-binding domain-containing protein [Helianthus annuus]|nr:putative reverse transcriptase zinc-binding domain-containing protein [Helianthus annuus]
MSRHKLRWIRWEFILKSKKLGGMGLGEIRLFNLAIISKWWWRFASNPDDLWVSVVKAIHGSSSSELPTSIPLKNSIPGLWKDICSVNPALEKMGVSLKDKLVESEGRWKWGTEMNGSFSVKQVRSDLEKASNDSEGFIYVWNNWAPPKVNYLLWRAIFGKVASRVGLAKRGVPILDCSCPRCGLYIEDPDHLFFKCIWSRSVWWILLTWMRIKFPIEIANLRELIGYIQNQPGSINWKRVVYTVALATVWRIWKARNEMIFEGRFIPVSNIVEQVKDDVLFWISNRTKVPSPGWVEWRSFDISIML